jgi:hypothetical protein
MKDVLGVSAFGLNDCVVQAGVGYHKSGFYLADAELPMNPFGHIRTGKEAKDERTHTGLYWPPEAQIKPGEPLRRIPIPYAWRALVEAGDRNIRWGVGQGVSFPLPRILARHVAGLIADCSPDQGLSRNTYAPSDSQCIQPVVAIPNNLDEFGQEALLRELSSELRKLGREGLKKAMLVWRPVAAALSWLDKVEGDFPHRMGENDHIHVVYLGPDALEFTTFRLRVKEHNNQLYVLPLRDRPEHLPHLTGMDWTGRLIENTFRGIEHGAFWQAFTIFPEIWRAIAGQAWNHEELPRAWSQKEGWTLWNPSPQIYDQIYDVKAGPCDTLREILRGSCRLNSRKETSSESIGKALRREVRRMTESLPDGRLRGMIVCGPLVPREVLPWLDAELDALSARGLNVNGELSEPEAGRLWLCTDCDDPVAEGAAIYGQRTLAGIPSYFDTMPQVSLLAQGQGQYTWVPLLNAQEVLGGAEFKDTVRERFQLDQGRRELHVYLYKGPLGNAPKPDDTFDAFALPFKGITPCQARLIREVVRKLGSVEAVRQRSFFQTTANGARYSLAFAKALFEGEDSGNDKASEPSMADMHQTPLRRAVFNFPEAPTRDVVLDVEVRMRPASGLARVELVPKDTSFLQGRKAQLNYSTMREASRIPRRQIGWPSIQELVVDPDDGALKTGIHIVERFENTLPTSDSYWKIIDEIRKHLLKKKTKKSIAVNFELWVHAIDQDGQACTPEGNAIIQRIVTKFESDFQSLKSSQKDRVLSKASWLYTSTPDNIITYVKGILAGDFTQMKWRWATEAASRAFITEEDFRILFKAIARRAGNSTGSVKPFPIEAARSIWRVLMLRKDGEKGLDRNMAQLFAHRALERLQQEQRKQSFNRLYFQLIRLLLYLLRYRRTDPSCFDPNTPQSIAVFDEAMESMNEAKRYFLAAAGFRKKARQVQEIIDGFKNYLHYKGTENVLTVLGDLAGDIDAG